MSSERVTLQLYLNEIVTLVDEGVTSSSWASKKKVSKFFPLHFLKKKPYLLFSFLTLPSC